jgi:hypothetical protein
VSAPEVDYLSAVLRLTESGRGEVREFHVSPHFDAPKIELSIIEGVTAEDEAFVILNRRQIECLADFLTAWLARATIAPAPSSGPGPARSPSTPASGA